MFKNKLKNNLICEYIELCQIQNCCNHQTNCEEVALISEKVKQLKKKYECVLFRIGYMDLSFYLLKKETSSINKNFIEMKNNMMELFDQKLESLQCDLVRKMKKLLFNEIEISFVENFG